jgi:hypothetical protein
MDFVNRPEISIIENTTFRKLDVVPSSGKGRETPRLLGPLETANLSRWTSWVIEVFLRDPTVWVTLYLHLKAETDPVSETLRFLVFRIMDDGQRPEAQ